MKTKTKPLNNSQKKQVFNQWIQTGNSYPMLSKLFGFTEKQIRRAINTGLKIKT